MPSNEKLIESIKAIDGSADLTDKSNAEMVAILKDLRTTDDLEAAPKEAAEAKAETKTAKKAEAKEKANAKKPPYTIAEGKSITTKRGILADGDEIKAKDLPGGKEAIESFVKSGHVVKN